MKKILLIILAVIVLAVALLVFLRPAQERVRYHDAGKTIEIYCVAERG